MEKRNYSLVYRIMHWAIAICMIFMLITIFLRLNWMNKNHVADIIKNYLSTTNKSLSEDQLITLAKQIRKPMWDWHVYIGYVLVGLYSIRMLLPLFGEMGFPNPFKKGLNLKEKFQFGVYLIFYGCVVTTLTTGLIIQLGPKELKQQMESIHALSIYYLLAFIFIHLGGVLMAELTSQQGIVSEIVSGKKRD